MSVAKSSLKDFHYLRITDDTLAKKVLSGSGSHPKDVLVNFPRGGVSDKEYQKKPLGLALFGLGRIGMIHFLNIMKTLDVELLYCVDYDRERLNYVQFKFNLRCKLLTPDEADQIFSDQKVDVIIICTPTFTHEELVLKGLKAGKAVFSEKPLALCSEEEEAKAAEKNGTLAERPLFYNHQGIKRCYDLAKEVGKPLFCAFNRRYDPTFQEIKERVGKGELGEVHVVKTCARDSPKPSMAYLKTSGGIFHDCAVHDLDLVCWVVGEFPSSVSAIGHSFDKEIEEIEDYDTVVITLKFPSGALGIIDLSRSSNYGYDQRLEVFGEKGMLASGGVRPTAVELQSDLGTVQNNICYSFASRYLDGYYMELDDFLQEVRGYKVASIPGQTVLNINKIAAACLRSAKEGTLVNLVWD